MIYLIICKKFTMYGDATLAPRNLQMSMEECFIKGKIIAKANLIVSFVTRSLNTEKMNTNTR
jgi:hypothetical protein